MRIYNYVSLKKELIPNHKLITTSMKLSIVLIKSLKYFMDELGYRLRPVFYWWPLLRMKVFGKFVPSKYYKGVSSRLNIKIAKNNISEKNKKYCLYFCFYF